MSSTNGSLSSSSSPANGEAKLKHVTQSLPKLVLSSTNSSSTSSFNSSNGGGHDNNSIIINGLKTNGKSSSSPSPPNGQTQPTSLIKTTVSKSNSKKIEFKDDNSIEDDKNDKPTKPIRSISSDNDDAFIEGVLNAKDRRTSWQQIRTQRSYIPSLSAICKLILFFHFKL